MNKKQKHLEFLNSALIGKRNFTVEQEKLINSFIFNRLLLALNMHNNNSMVCGNFEKNCIINIYDCINYFANKLRQLEED